MNHPMNHNCFLQIHTHIFALHPTLVLFLPNCSFNPPSPLALYLPHFIHSHILTFSPTSSPFLTSLFPPSSLPHFLISFILTSSIHYLLLLTSSILTSSFHPFSLPHFLISSILTSSIPLLLLLTSSLSHFLHSHFLTSSPTSSHFLSLPHFLKYTHNYTRKYQHKEHTLTNTYT